MKKQLLILGLCSALLTGCTGFFLGKENTVEPVDLPQTTQIIAFERQWQTGIGDGVEDKSLQLRPTVVDKAVYSVSADGVLTALTLDSGERIWRQKVGHRIAAGVSANQQIVVVGTENGLLMAFSAVDGEPQWTYQLSTEILVSPNVAAGVVVARAIDGQVTAIDAATGKMRWKQYIGVSDLSIRGNATGLYLDGAMLFTTDKGRMVVLSLADGRPIFDTPVVVGRGMTAVERIADLLATPTIYNGVLYVSAYRHKTLAINLKDGKLLWESPHATALDLFVDQNFLYVVDKDSVIRALDSRNGQVVWRSEAFSGRKLSPIAGNGRVISVVDFEGMMSVLDSRNGDVLGYQSVGSERSYVAPLLTREGWVTYTSDGELTLTRMVAR